MFFFFTKKSQIDDLEVHDLKHLQTTQEEMMKKLSIVDDSIIDNDQQTTLLKPTMNVTKKLGWRKGWSWKQSPVKASSIEEEPTAQLDSQRRSQHSSKSSTPNLSPKHSSSNNISSETVHEDENSSILVRRKQRTQQQKIELRSSASARLIQFFETKDNVDKIYSEDFYSLIPDKNGRPASIHVIQSASSNDVL